MLPPMRLMWRLCSAINRGCWNISLLLIGSSSLSKTFSNCEILSCQFQGNSFNEREISDEETLKKENLLHFNLAFGESEPCVLKQQRTRRTLINQKAPWWEAKKKKQYQFYWCALLNWPTLSDWQQGTLASRQVRCVQFIFRWLNNRRLMCKPLLAVLHCILNDIVHLDN